MLSSRSYLFQAAVLCSLVQISQSYSVSYPEMRNLLQNAARGQDVDLTIQAIHELLPRVPAHEEEQLNLRKEEQRQRLLSKGGETPRHYLGDPEVYTGMLERSIQHREQSMARYLCRLFLEEGDATAAADIISPYDDIPKMGKKRSKNNPLKGDLHFGLAEYEQAIACYQDSLQLGLPSFERMTSLGFGIKAGDATVFSDDILLSKIGFAQKKLGVSKSVWQKKFELAAELQVTNGFYLDALVSSLRMEDFETARKLLELPELAKGYPLACGIAKEYTEQQSPPQPSAKTNTNENTSMLGLAFQSYVEGDYVTSRRQFVRAPDSPEKCGLFGLLLRERHLAYRSDIYNDRLRRSALTAQKRCLGAECYEQLRNTTRGDEDKEQTKG